MAEFTSLTIKDDKSKNSVSITPDGIWVSSSGSVSASVQIDNGRPLLTVMDHRNTGQMGHQLALSVDKDGAPVLQVSHRGNTVILTGEELIEFFNKTKEQ